MIKDLDTADELHEAATVRITSYHNRLANLYNKCVKPRMFQSRDLVQRIFFENTAGLLAEQFQPNWKGPYFVTRPSESGLYALDKLDGTPVSRM